MFLCLAAFQGGFSVGSSYYMLFREGRTWSEDRQFCLEKGGYLAELTTRSELDAVKQALGKSHHNLLADIRGYSEDLKK